MDKKDQYLFEGILTVLEKQSCDIENITYIRNFPQISATISPEDKELLNKITLYWSNRLKKPLTISVIIRALIQFGHKHMELLEIYE